MRVHEFAKEKGVSSKEAISLLKKAGVDVSSHMSVIDEKDLARLAPKGAAGSKPKIGEEKQAPSASPSKKPKAPSSAGGGHGHRSGGRASEGSSSASGGVRSSGGRRSTQGSRSRKKYSRGVRSGASRVPEKVVSEITIDAEMSLACAAELMGKPSGELILSLLRQGVVCNRNHVLSVDAISFLAHQYGIKSTISAGDGGKKSSGGVAVSSDGTTRWPVVVVMGHVDHGKTTLLDFVRKMNVAAREAGGITQHLAAYEVSSAHGKIVFLDTPGHEAFSYMREKGARVTDIAILVVAADDGVMPQTIEAIKHAKAAEVPIIVAINKIDKIDSSVPIESVKRQLAQQDLLPEDWGGDVICVPISAKTGKGVEELLEMIVLQAQMLELKADSDVAASAFILESNIEKGYGPVATVICRNGSLRIGDYFSCGSSTGKVRLLIDMAGNKISLAAPSVPVRVVGFDSFASLGDWLKVIPAEEYFAKRKGKVDVASARGMASASIGAMEKPEELAAVPLVIKTDTQGSLEAVLGAIKAIEKMFVDVGAFVIINSAIGDVSEGDVETALDNKAHLVALHVKVERNATALARERGTSIHKHNIIYKLIEDLEEVMESHRKEISVWNKTGEALVLKTFDLKGKGVIAGCVVKDGVISRKGKVVCLRNGVEVGSGMISSLQRERKVVKEVHKGHECGFLSNEFNGWAVDDVVHCFIEEKKKAGA